MAIYTFYWIQDIIYFMYSYSCFPMPASNSLNYSKSWWKRWHINLLAFVSRDGLNVVTFFNKYISLMFKYLLCLFFSWTNTIVQVNVMLIFRVFIILFVDWVGNFHHPHLLTKSIHFIIKTGEWRSEMLFKYLKP